MFRINSEVPPRVQEHTVGSVSFVNFAFLKRSKVRELHVVGRDGNLLVELGNLLQIELRHRPRAMPVTTPCKSPQTYSTRGWVDARDVRATPFTRPRFTYAAP